MKYYLVTGGLSSFVESFNNLIKFDKNSIQFQKTWPKENQLLNLLRIHMVTLKTLLMVIRTRHGMLNHVHTQIKDMDNGGESI